MTMKKFLALILAVSMLVCSVPAFAEDDDNGAGNKVNALNDILQIVQNSYYKDITKEEILYKALEELILSNPELFDQIAKGAFEALDEYSVYLTDEEYEDRLEDVNKEFCGIGVSVSLLNEKFLITKVHKNTPAIASGLKEGDIITQVDGVDIKGFNLEKAVSMIRGEAGTNVLLTIERNGVSTYYTVPRAKVTIESVEGELLENKTAYIRIDSFSQNTFTEFTKIYNDFIAQGVEKFILDLRNNGGGYLKTAVNIGSVFVPKGKILVTEDYKNDKYDQTHYSVGDHERKKVVVLVNEYSASASEVLTGAIKENKAGIVVGTKTFGKGTVQTSWDLINCGAIWLTIAQYNLPSGKNIHGIGIQPDYVVENTTKSVDLSKFNKITKEKVLRYGDTGPQVLALKQHLSAIGFTFISMDEKYDDELVYAVTALQGATGLFPYGVADITTQSMILQKAGSAVEVVDNQLEKAKELIYKMK